MNDNTKQTVPVTNLEKVKDVMRCNLPEGFILIKLIEKESKIIKPSGSSMSYDSTLKVVKVGDKVEKTVPGDVVVDLKSEVHGVYFYTKDGDNYLVTDQYNLLLWTPEDNYAVNE